MIGRKSPAKRWGAVLLIVFLFALPLFAQEDDEAEDTVTFGNVVTGRLDDRTPRQVYSFDGLRCERINISPVSYTHLTLPTN